MKTRKRLIKKMPLVAMLTLLFAGLACLTHMQSYADGTITVNVGNQDSWPAGTEFTFELYKVGEYGRDDDGEVIFDLHTELADAGVDHEVLKKLADASNYKDGVTSGQEWLNTANTLATFINGMTSGKPETQTATAVFGDNGTASFNIPVDENGLYLLVGRSKEIGDKLWTPQPMFISVLNGKKEITFDNSDEFGVKMSSRDIVYEHNVIKMWTGDEAISEYVRPDKVAVKIMYGSTYVDTVILDKNDAIFPYYYCWKHVAHYDSGNNAAIGTDDTVESIDYYVPERDEDGKIKTDTVDGKIVVHKYVLSKEKIKVNPDDAGWSVIEVRDTSEIPDAEAKKQAPQLRYYNTSYLPQQVTSETESFTITNDYTCKMLKLKKSIDGYVDDGQNVAFSFKIIGKDSKGKEIYSNHLGVSFERDEGVTKEVVLNNIPGTVETIEVVEEYSGNYTQDGPVKITELTKQDADGGTAYVVGWQAEVKNKHNDHGPGGGVVNKYDHDKDKPEQYGGSEPEPDDNN